MKQDTPKFHDTSINARTSYLIDGELSYLNFDIESAEWRIDDIHRNTIALVSASKSPHAEVVVELDPQQAMQLAEVLVEAAELVSEGYGEPQL